MHTRLRSMGSRSVAFDVSRPLTESEMFQAAVMTARSVSMDAAGSGGFAFLASTRISERRPGQASRIRNPRPRHTH